MEVRFLYDEIGSSSLTRANRESLTAIVVDPTFARKAADMLEHDLTESRPMAREELEGRSFLSRAFARACLLLAPVL